MTMLLKGIIEVMSDEESEAERDGEIPGMDQVWSVRASDTPLEHMTATAMFRAPGESTSSSSGLQPLRTQQPQQRDQPPSTVSKSKPSGDHTEKAAGLVSAASAAVPTYGHAEKGGWFGIRCLCCCSYLWF